MTNTQIGYWNYVEGKRHNIMSEQLTANQLAEAVRHNKVGEKISANSLNESIRHNKVSEKISANSLAETKRHNKVGERVSVQSLNESKRHNRVQEKLGTRQTNISEAQTNANIQLTKAQTVKTQKEADYMLVKSIAGSGTLGAAFAALLGFDDLSHNDNVSLTKSGKKAAGVLSKLWTYESDKEAKRQADPDGELCKKYSSIVASRKKDAPKVYQAYPKSMSRADAKKILDGDKETLKKYGGYRIGQYDYYRHDTVGRNKRK